MERCAGRPTEAGYHLVEDVEARCRAGPICANRRDHGDSHVFRFKLLGLKRGRKVLRVLLLLL